MIKKTITIDNTMPENWDDDNSSWFPKKDYKLRCRRKRPIVNLSRDQEKTMQAEYIRKNGVTRIVLADPDGHETAMNYNMRDLKKLLTES